MRVVYLVSFLIGTIFKTNLHAHSIAPHKKQRKCCCFLSLQPVAAGSGIPEIKCYLNGIKVQRNPWKQGYSVCKIHCWLMWYCTRLHPVFNWDPLQSLCRVIHNTMTWSAPVTVLGTTCDSTDYPDRQGSRRSVQCCRRYVMYQWCTCNSLPVH